MVASTEVIQETVSRESVQTRETTVLCVDDESSILTALKRLMRKQPCRLLTASSGDEALELIDKSEVD